MPHHRAITVTVHLIHPFHRDRSSTLSPYAILQADQSAQPTPRRHRLPPSRREAPPNDGLRRTIQYAEALVMESKGPRCTGCPACAGHDGGMKNQLARRANQLSFARCRLARTPLRAKNRVRVKSNFVSRFKLIWVVSPPRTNISLSENQKLCILPAVPLSLEGRLAIVTDVEAGCGGRGSVARRAILVRTAKACGLGAPTLALSRR